MIGEAKRAVRIPVIGNGDVRAPEDVRAMLERTGCDAVMLGRAAFGDPWVFRRSRAFLERGEKLPPPSAAERLATGVRHLRMLVAEVGEAAAAREMRKHVAWYIKGLPRSARVRDQVNHTRSAAELAELLAGYLAELEREGLAAFAPEPTLADDEALRATG
jgi:tRNA-dihydrouridine synthase B